MKKYWSLIPFAVLVAVAVVGWFVLPATLVVQINSSGQASNTLPKWLGLLIPVVLGAIGAGYAGTSTKRSAGIAVLAVAFVVSAMTFVWNL